MSNEDEKSAVNMSFSLSNQLMAAALAMLAILGAFFAYVSANREPGSTFFIFAALTFFVFVASIYIGGRGISKSYKEGFSGTWKLSTGKSFFNAQATLCLIGLFLFAATVIYSGPSNESEFQELLSRLGEDIQNIKIEHAASTKQINCKIENLEKDLKLIKSSVVPIEKKNSLEKSKEKITT